MADEDRPAPALSEAVRRRQEDQRERLAAALRENLLKRKRQSRERLDGEEGGGAGL